MQAKFKTKPCVKFALWRKVRKDRESQGNVILDRAHARLSHGDLRGIAMRCEAVMRSRGKAIWCTDNGTKAAKIIEFFNKKSLKRLDKFLKMVYNKKDN